MIIFFEIILIALALFLLVWILFIFSFTRRLVAAFLRGEAPFVPTKSSILPMIAEALELTEESVLFDLGCGDARVLVACHKTQPKAGFAGFEKDFVPYFWAKFRLRMMGLSKKIKIRKKDFFDADFSRATHVFCYLVPKQVEKIRPKLEKEIPPGGKVFSLRFAFENKIPQRTIQLGKEKLYVYEF